ncbi:MAG: IclR family transcriptional regulator [Hydrogenophaga sp.]|jgi:DNA-binding IclR family transcriptional regulator|uniref:IclR family transcriptional regulator n=1 Tax=Hydrogenophaga sp. TaxID=1904254 RepID=UPI0027266FEB|nr:IclR family transcriptional regulator [Hydrogenophaga sp.]MDO9029982.1 IclR family transcriptional regulator [Hydrogenophaga sp.]
MKSVTPEPVVTPDAERRSYSAPALEKGLDILEMLCRSEQPLTQKEIAVKLGRSVGEIYRMVTCLVDRNYVTQVDDSSYTVTTKLFELSHINPPTHRLLFEAQPIMQRLAKELDQSCHLTVYSQGKQVVLTKVDTPSGMGFSVRAGSELDVLISASGRVLLAFQDDETRKLWIEESLQRRPDQSDPQTSAILDTIRTTGFESIPSVQVRGLYAVSFPILDTQGNAIAALTVPYSERIDQNQRKSIPAVTEALGRAARSLSQRVGGMSMGAFAGKGPQLDALGHQAKQYA